MGTRVEIYGKRRNQNKIIEVIIMSFKSLLVVFLLALTTNIYAQYISADDARKQEIIDESRKNTEALEDLRGKTFWYRPNPKAINVITFLEPGKSGGAPVPYREAERKFNVVTETSFVIENYEIISNGMHSFDSYFLKLVFPDGKVGYVNIHNPYKTLSETTSGLPLYHGRDNFYDDFREYIFSRPPQEIYDAEEKAANIELNKRKISQAKLAAEMKARGGVKIGMTVEQVLRSNWGKPRGVNRTTTPNGTHEQWIYGDRNFLYFVNGILTTIQD